MCEGVTDLRRGERTPLSAVTDPQWGERTPLSGAAGQMGVFVPVLHGLVATWSVMGFTIMVKSPFYLNLNG